MFLEDAYTNTREHRQKVIAEINFILPGETVVLNEELDLSISHARVNDTIKVLLGEGIEAISKCVNLLTILLQELRDLDNEMEDRRHYMYGCPDDLTVSIVPVGLSLMPHMSISNDIHTLSRWIKGDEPVTKKDIAGFMGKNAYLSDWTDNMDGILMAKSAEAEEVHVGEYIERCKRSIYGLLEWSRETLPALEDLSTTLSDCDMSLVSSQESEYLTGIRFAMLFSITQCSFLVKNATPVIKAMMYGK